MILWFTGKPAAGKTSTCKQLRLWFSREFPDQKVIHLDGDEFRSQVGNWEFSASQRELHLRYAVLTASLFEKEGYVVLCSFISPTETSRLFVKDKALQGKIIWMNTSDQEREQRDWKGLQKKNGEGFEAKYYEEPISYDFEFRNGKPEEAANAFSRLAEEVREWIGQRC